MSTAEEGKKGGRAPRDLSAIPPLPRELESGNSRFWRKVKENPFVPLGMAATVGALVFGLFHFNRGNAAMQQKMMRARVIAQGSTVLFLVGGIALGMIKHEKDGSPSK